LVEIQVQSIMTNQVEIEKCVVCGKETGVPVNTHIDMRKTYVEGVGDMCAGCFIDVYKKINKDDDNAQTKP